MLVPRRTAALGCGCVCVASGTAAAAGPLLLPVLMLVLLYENPSKQLTRATSSTSTATAWMLKQLAASSWHTLSRLAMSDAACKGHQGGCQGNSGGTNLLLQDNCYVQQLKKMR